ncbi:MAG: hypothetical protein R6U01_00580 [Halorubrum sp.]|uniref:hypothetical protein n=1 Tax=Halorubrum sp. TaxID=1879286 RepID=UPI003970A5B8
MALIGRRQRDDESEGVGADNPVSSLVRWVLLSADRRVLTVATELVILAALHELSGFVDDYDYSAVTEVAAD